MNPTERAPVRDPERSVATAAHRRDYEPPRLTFREPLEGVASVCGPPTGKSNGLCLITSS